MDKTEALIRKLVKHMERADDEAEREVPVLLDEIIKTFEPTTAVLAEEAVVAWRAAMGTCPARNPKLWRRRFKRFIDLTEAIFKRELGVEPRFYHHDLIHGCEKCQ